LSHRQKTGQQVALPLYLTLSNLGYKVFLDTHAEFELHDLKRLVSNTTLFVFVLSEGILDSEFCFNEFETGVQSNKKIVLIRVPEYNLPPVASLPQRWVTYQDILYGKTHLRWDTQYAKDCAEDLINKLKKVQTKKQ